MNNINVFFEKSINYKIKEIDPKTRFWMVRTKKGYFYDEFVAKEFIALGWNIITSTTDLEGQSLDVVKNELQEKYGDKIPMMSINKCKKFIDIIKEGDYILVPSEGSTRITIAIAGGYY